MNQQFTKLAALLYPAALLAHFFIARSTLASTLSTALLATAVLVAGYFIARQHVWISLSTAGISGTGYTGRKVLIAWHETTTVNPSKNSGMHGVEVRSSTNDGLVKSRLLSLFVPSPILHSQQFVRALEGLAPSSHPLNASAQNAT